MKTKHGFTLVEVLVVVLIIGILAAIALPQYEKAVEKSRATQALTLLKSAYQAAAAYYMNTGEYPNTFADMGFEVPWTGNTAWSTVGHETDTKSNNDWSLQIYQAFDGGLAIRAGRISGKYAGGGFSVAVVDSDHQLTSGPISCLEKTAGGITFSESLQPGDYCVKIMNGIKGDDSVNHRNYDLP